MRPYPFVLAVCSPLVAQAPFQGNGVGGCELQASTAVIGGTLALEYGSSNVPNGIALALSSTGSLVFERGFHAATVLANGDVLLTGGSTSNLLFGSITASDRCERWNGSTWATVANLPVALTNHVQVRTANGDALVFGGLTGAYPNLTASAVSGRHTGAAYTAGLQLGLNPGFPAATAGPRGAATGAQLADGTLLIVGGTDGATALSSVLLFQP